MIFGILGGIGSDLDNLFFVEKTAQKKSRRKAALT